MAENERFLSIIQFLISSKKIRNQQDFVERVWSDKATISQIKTGKIGIPNNLFEKIASSFPEINCDWLKTGEGEMLNNQNIGNISNSTVVGANVNGSGNNITHNNFAEMIELQKGYQELLKKKDEHISELLLIVNKLTYNEK
jgi:hypothetical protein